MGMSLIPLAVLLVMMLKLNLLMLLLSENIFSEETLLNIWNLSKVMLISTRDNSVNIKLLVLVLVIWKLFMKVSTKQSKQILLLKRRLLLFQLVKNQRDTTNKDCLMLNARTESSKNLLLLPRRTLHKFLSQTNKKFGFKKKKKKKKKKSTLR